MGHNFTAGILDEAVGRDRDEGILDLGDKILERQLAGEIGAQLGAGLTSGATELTPEQIANLERAIDGLLSVATVQAADGLRRDVSPQLREMVRRDIVMALADGMRNDVGPTLEETIDRVITRAVLALRTAIQDEDTRIAISDMIRDAVYRSMREGSQTSPAVGETLQMTLTENVLSPFESSIETIADTVTQKVEEQSRRTENTLKAVIIFLAVVLGIILFMYMFAQRQMAKERQKSSTADTTARHLGVVLGLLDEDTRRQIMGKLDEVRSIDLTSASNAVSRSDDYLRGDKK